MKSIARWQDQIGWLKAAVAVTATWITIAFILSFLMKVGWFTPGDLN